MVDVDGKGVVGQVADTEEVEEVFEEADKCSPDLSAKELRIDSQNIVGYVFISIFRHSLSKVPF